LICRCRIWDTQRVVHYGLPARHRRFCWQATGDLFRRSESQRAVPRATAAKTRTDRFMSLFAANDDRAVTRPLAGLEGMATQQSRLPKHGIVMRKYPNRSTSVLDWCRFWLIIRGVRRNWTYWRSSSMRLASTWSCSGVLGDQLTHESLRNDPL
jgi:hypothetical protein